MSLALSALNLDVFCASVTWLTKENSSQTRSVMTIKEPLSTSALSTVGDNAFHHVILGKHMTF